MRTLAPALVLLGTPVGLIIAYWCLQDVPIQFKIMAICLQSTGAMIGVTALVALVASFISRPD